MTIPLTVALMTYNRSHYLKQAIQGILDQTYRNFEFLILDNHSTDDTPAVVLGCDDPRIRYVRNAPGHRSAFNGASAMQIARGARLIITHDDDIMMPTMLEKQMAIMDEHPDMTAVWVNIDVIDETGRLVQRYFVSKGNDRIYKRGEYIARYPSERLLPIPSGLMLDRNRTPRLLFGDAFYYGRKKLSEGNTSTHGGDDIIFPALMNIRGPVAFLNEPLLQYRRHSVQDSNDVDISKPVLKTHQVLHRLLRKYASKIPDSARTEPLLSNYVLRYETQHEVVNTSGMIGRRAQTKLAKWLAQGMENVGKSPEAVYPILPLLILLSQHGMDAEALFSGLSQPTPAQPSDVRASYQWAMLRKGGGNLFASLPEGANIAILGSALIAALLVNEAKVRGLGVVCMDSKPSRQNREMLGVPIHAPEWLKSQGDGINYAILSSERDQEDYLRPFILGLNKQVKVFSWKELANGLTP